MHMSSTFFISAALALAITGSLLYASVPAHAQAQRPSASTQQEHASLLGGKIKFALPPDFVDMKIPSSPAANGSEGVTAFAYANQARQQMVLASEQSPMAEGARAQDNDARFLDGVMASFIRQQASWPQYQRQGEKSHTIKGLGFRQIDAIASFDGIPMRVTLLLAGSGDTLALIRITSKADDAAGHDSLVASVLEGIRS